ncbi:hypothetical protein CYMTET_53095, partial [Cymbomonas tetramitiformis]
KLSIFLVCPADALLVLDSLRRVDVEGRGFMDGSLGEMEVQQLDPSGLDLISWNHGGLYCYFVDNRSEDLELRVTLTELRNMTALLPVGVQSSTSRSVVVPPGGREAILLQQDLDGPFAVAYSRSHYRVAPDRAQAAAVLPEVQPKNVEESVDEAPRLDEFIAAMINNSEQQERCFEDPGKIVLYQMEGEGGLSAFVWENVSEDMIYKEVNSVMMVGMKAFLDGELLAPRSVMETGQEIVQFIIAIQPGARQSLWLQPKRGASESRHTMLHAGYRFPFP